MRRFWFHPLFVSGLFLRFLLSICFQQKAVAIWYAPFLNHSLHLFSWDPWSSWIQAGGNELAFPYGYVMWLWCLPFVSVGHLFQVPERFAYLLSLFFADLGLFLTLRQRSPRQTRALLLSYWLSPVIILATYGLGFNDIVPAWLLYCAIDNMRRLTFWRAGFLCIAAISAKLSMIVALPFFLLYLINHRALHQVRIRYLWGALFGIFLWIAPFGFSWPAVRMLFGNPEMWSIYQLALPITATTRIYFVPLLYTLLVYAIWRVRRLNFDLFDHAIGLAFFSIVLMTPASPGWFVWSIPFLALYQARSGYTSVVLITLFSTFYVLHTLLVTDLFALGRISITHAYLGDFLHTHSGHIFSLLQTGMVTVGSILTLRLLRESIAKNDFFRLSRKPFVLSICGDSGSGKDTLANAITQLFGQHSVSHLCGDNYHLWDRQKSIWQVMTHLNPRANDLERFSSDLIRLTNGRSIQVATYDHQSGKRHRPQALESNDIVIASGLHTLYLPTLRACANLRIYLDIHESLRRHLKIQRDVHQRGHPLEAVLDSFTKREADAKRFIRPQAQFADLRLSLQPVQPWIRENKAQSLSSSALPRLKLVVGVQQGLHDLALHRVLVGICGLHVDITTEYDGGHTQITIEGESKGDDMAVAAKLLCPQALQFLDLKPGWQDGISGLMQLISLFYIDQAFNKRFI